uniref:CASP8-associated protein 2 n=1 Tax=Lygus hesperus TaxID=30085 RepID=A0A146LMX1_LYGHE
MDGCEEGDAEISATVVCEEELNDELDIYNDLPDFRYDETIDKLNATIAKLEAENNELHSMLTEMKKEKDILETKCSALITNITSLLKTAKLEIQRKERTINDLRQQLSGAASSNKFRLKRQFENPDWKKNADINYSKCDSQTREPVSKKPRLSELDRTTKDMGSKNEETMNGNVTTLKPPSKVTQASQKENVPLTPVQKHTPAGKMNATSKVSAPILPAINCPTLFSSRMYQRLNNQSATQTITLPSVPLIPICDEEPLNRVPVGRINVNEQPQCAIPTEKTVSKTPDDTVKLPGCNLFFQKPTSSSVGAVIEKPNLTSAKNDSSRKRTELNLRSVSDLKKVVCESVTKSDSPQSLSNKCKVRNNGLDRVKSVFPPAKMSTPLSSDRATKFQFSNAKNNKSTLMSFKSSKHLDTRSTLLKVLPNGKGKSVKKVFVPISSAWNCSKPPSCTPPDEASNNKCQQSENAAEGEMGAEVTRVTSELTVKVDNEILDESGKQAVDLFGSPAKWADDCSSDSVKVDGIVNRKKIDYSLFGSPYKNGDSCSSEPVNFVLPPGAYEDSCFTNQPPDKVSPRPVKTPPPITSLPDLTSNLVSSKNKCSDSASGSNDRDGRKNDDSFSLPALKSSKKGKSVFSPLKDSKTAASLPTVALDDRSSTGICFPFKHTNRYEDSVLGQFDDTAQFVSALAKVDTKISPLSTPMKNSDVIDEFQMTQCQTINTSSANNPTSFKEVFRNKNLQDVPMVASNDDYVVTEKQSSKVTCQVKNTEPSASTSLGSVDFEKSQEKAENVLYADEKAEESIATEKRVDSSSSLSNSKFIHRSNFSSSFVFTVSSDSQSFHDKPVNVLKPRKTPRAVVNKRSPVAPTGSCNDVNLNPRIAIPDAFITEQEERVRQWQKNHLYENTLKSGTSPKTPSPTKCLVKMNGSSSDTTKASTPMKAQSKIYSLGKNRLKPPSPCNALGTSSSESRTQEKTGVINRLQPKRVPRHPVTSGKNSDGVLKAVATKSKPRDDTPSNVLDNDPPCTVAVAEMVVPMPVSVPVSAKSNEGDRAIDIPNTIDSPHIIKQNPDSLRNKYDGRLQYATGSDKTEEIATAGNTTPVPVDEPPCALDTTNKALNMIYSVMSNIVSGSTTSNNLGETVGVSSPIDPVHLKTEPIINNEKLLEKIDISPKNRLVEVSCTQRSSMYVECISQVKPSSTQNFNSKLRVSNISGPFTSKSTPIIMKKSMVNRDSDFKRSSALKRFGDKAKNNSINSNSNSPTTAEGVLEENYNSKGLPSKRVLIRRKSAPNLNVSSQSLGNRTANKTLTRTFSSSSLKNVQDPISHIAEVLPVKWIVHPIELDLPENIYGCISSSFSSKDPRALPRLVEPRSSLSSKDEDNQNVKVMRKLNHWISPNASIIGRVSEQSSSEINLTRPIVTSTPFPLKRDGALATDTRENRTKRLSTSKETFLLETATKHPILRRSERVVKRSTIQLDSPIKQERKARGKKRPAATQPELASPEESCKESKRTPGNRKSPKGPSKSDISTESPPATDAVTTSTTSPAPEPVVQSHPHPLTSTTSLSQSVITSTAQPLLITRKRRIPILSSVTLVHSDKPVIVSRKRPPSFGVYNNST